jgi:hypothetical protein
MEIIKIDEKVYEVLECGNLDGNISHVRFPTGKIASVVATAYDIEGDFYFIVKRSGHDKDIYWEKDFEEFAVTPLKLLGIDLVEDCVEEEVITGKVVSVRRCDDHDLVEFMVPPGVGEYLYIVGEFDVSLDEE